jgi:hypothetical protein
MNNIISLQQFKDKKNTNTTDKEVEIVLSNELLSFKSQYEKNKISQEKLKEERKRVNKNVLKEYRIK